eukprot:gene16502-22729_t
MIEQTADAVVGLAWPEWGNGRRFGPPGLAHRVWPGSTNGVARQSLQAGAYRQGPPRCTRSSRGSQIRCRPEEVMQTTEQAEASSTVFSLADLRQQLDCALGIENYAAAARLKKAIQQKESDAKFAVEDANLRFYEAYDSCSIEGMDEMWGAGEHIQVVHPGAACITGRDAVLASWEKVLGYLRPRSSKVSVEEVRVAASEYHGFVTCVEVMEADGSKGRICTTNVFEKQNGKWLITHHHGGPLS